MHTVWAYFVTRQLGMNKAHVALRHVIRNFQGFLRLTVLEQFQQSYFNKYFIITV